MCVLAMSTRVRDMLVQPFPDEDARGGALVTVVCLGHDDVPEGCAHGGDGRNSLQMTDARTGIIHHMNAVMVPDP